MNKVRRSFSILEIMVAIAIVSLVATFGHAAYQRFLIRAQISEGIHVLEEYQSIAMREFARSAAVDAYYVLFTDVDTAGLVSGAPGNTAAEKQVNLKYVDSVTVDVDNSPGMSIILLGAKLRDVGDIVAGANFVYLRGTVTNGATTWLCGMSSVKANNVPAVYLPATCQNQF